MIELRGKYNTAKVFTNQIEEEAIGQIIQLLNQEFVAHSQIRMMPDTHAGAGCTIGTTMTVSDKIVPNLVGVDIGCGMETVVLKDRHIEVQALDKVIHQYIPAGFQTRSEAHPFMELVDLEQLRCKKAVNLNRAERSLGTLGGGNHFIEVAKDEEGLIYLVVHSGSRHLGKQVAEYYQKATAVKSAFGYLEGQLYEDYLHDMTIAQRYAELNRKAIVRDIMKRMKWKERESFTTIHNYIEMDTKILRKGAISAKIGEKSLIPINMRDGSLVCVGLGNPDWNFSAPHGAGRLMSRSKAKESITLSQFKKSMEGIYSTTIGQSTIDESAFAYKPMEEIVEHIGDTVEIVKRIRPIYNFKATE